MEVHAYIKNVRISPKKLRFLLPGVKKMSPRSALDVLFYSPEKSARILYKAIASAIANAKTAFKTDGTNLKFKVLTVEGARKLKRFRAGGRGMARPIMKRYSHIKVVLTADLPQSVQTPKVTGQVTKKPGKEARSEKVETENNPKLSNFRTSRKSKKNV